MIVLALECSTGARSVAVVRAVDDERAADPADLLGHRFVAEERGHATALLPMIDAALAEAGQTYDDIDLFAVSVGPGSYTGIRIGLATARGLALARAKKLAGVVTTLAVAHRIARVHASALAASDYLAVAMETKRDDLYLHVFAPSLDEVVPACAALPADAAAVLPAGRILVAGDAAGRLCDAAGRREVAALTDDHGLPDALDIALLAVRGRDLAVRVPGVGPSPLYLRPPDVTLATPPRSKGSGR